MAKRGRPPKNKQTGGEEPVAKDIDVKVTASGFVSASQFGLPNPLSPNALRAVTWPINHPNETLAQHEAKMKAKQSVIERK